MPRLSLYRSEKSNDYKFFDRNISEMFTIGATDLFVHKYIGTNNPSNSKELSKPFYDTLDPKNIQDLLFLENRDRKYDDNIYRIRGHYNVQNLDFDLSQFGLFLNNDIIFVTVHYNDMINILGRKLMVGDVIEMPHLTDYHPLNEDIPTGLRRYYQITDGNFASEGFSQTWFPHLWRIKCEPLVDSQEFSNILKAPVNKDNYVGEWKSTSTYVPGYVVSYGDKNYTPIQEVPAGIPCTDTNYWELDTADNLKDILGRYNKNIAINDAMIAEASRIVPKTGYDRSQLYVVPTSGGGKKPELAIDVVTNNSNPEPSRGLLTMAVTPGFNVATPALKISKGSLTNLWKLNPDEERKLKNLIRVNIEIARLKPDRLSTGSGQVEGDLVLAINAIGPVTGPYGTSDNTYSTADQDPTLPNFTGTVSPLMDFRADADPNVQFIGKYSPEGFGYTSGYMIGDGSTPNGYPYTAGITFPSNPNLGDYVLRTDYLPNILYRWDGNLWVKIGENLRADPGPSSTATLYGSFVNNDATTTLTDGTVIPQRQSLSEMFKIQPD